MKMNKQVTYSVLALILMVVTFSACKKEGSHSPYSKVTLSFENAVDDQAIKFGAIDYVNPAGNHYSVDLLKYYVSNFAFVRGDDSVFHFQRYLLVDASDSTKWSITLDSIPNGSFKALRFYVGVDSAHNHTLSQDGALDPSHGMIWDWKTGYIFFKHEGYFKNTAGVNTPLTQHLGTDGGLVTVDIPLNGIPLDGNPANMHIRFNLNDAYRSPNKFDFNKDGFHMSSGINDVFWIKDMADNLSRSFSLHRID